AVAHFRLMTGHVCIGEHLNRIGDLDINICPICKSGVMKLRPSPGLYGTRHSITGTMRSPQTILEGKGPHGLIVWMPAFSSPLDPWN
ncbi:hypothetical protein NPIL_91141, partial [Nephila pilipes]